MAASTFSYNLTGALRSTRYQCVDMEFVDAELVLSAQKLYGVDLYSPTHADQQWQSRTDSRFSGENFSIDWKRKQAVCPMGKTSSSWSDASTETGKKMVKIKFLTKDCRVCPVHHKCTKSKQIRRTLSILPEEQYELRQVARVREQTPEYKLEYRRRSGIEGTISQAVRGFGMRRSRYVGEAKTHLQNVLTATAVNTVRLSNWLNEVPIAKTRQPLFARVIRQAITT